MTKSRSSRNIAIVLAILVCLTAGCSSQEVRESCRLNPLLTTLLRAADRDFDDLLMQHGPVTQAEIPCILDASESWNRQKQMNAARLIVLADGDERTLFEAKRKIISETKHVEIWMYILDIGLELDKPGYDELAKLRPDMIQKALEYTNADSPTLQGKIQSTGLRAAVVAELPGVEDEIRKRLDSDISDIVEVALDAMPKQMAVAELPRLTKMLADYEGGKEYQGVRTFVFRSLLGALIRTENEIAFAEARKALEVDLTEYSSVKGVRKEFLASRNKLTFAPGEHIEKFSYYLIRENGPSAPLGYDMISTRVAKDLSEPTPAAIEACIAVIERGDQTTDVKLRARSGFDDPAQESCERLFQFLETGEFLGPNRKIGRDAVAIGKKWLAEYDPR